MESKCRVAVANIVLIALLVSGAAYSAGRLEESAEALKVPASQALLLEAGANGYQIYECKAAKDDPMRSEWVFKAPEADLFDRSGTKIGRHYAGPTWEANDGSKVVGEVRAKLDSPDAGAIPWLLLNAKEHYGDGEFAKVQSIKRMQTSGGIAPSEGCTPERIGAESRVPYKARYNFYGPKS
ncbi:MAG TPA: DUF3455 domain-containing protein [Dissulfurispiraceae bacterium]|nr:DUF3455 domain-containing protein [Dissulfurispiraceae bacterium]